MLEPWIETWTGKKFYFLNPDPDMIDIRDIAHSLAMQCRFTGHVDTFMSVAEHSVAVSVICNEENALQGLLHDASEAYLSDIASPIKQQFPQYYEMEHKLMEAIAKKFGFSYPISDDVKDADATQLKTEAKFLLSSWGTDWAALFPTQGRRGKVPLCLAPVQAEQLFLNSYEQITNETVSSTKESLILVA
jgi:hypothetical protein